MYITISCFNTAQYSQPSVFVSVLNLPLRATLDIMLSSLCCFAIIACLRILRDSSRTSGPNSKSRPPKRMFEVDQDPDAKPEGAKPPKLRQADLTDPDASTCDPRMT